MNSSFKKIIDVIGINSFALKMLAIVTMTIDHVGAVFFPNEMLLRMVGRLAFPIFCFLLVEGFYHTKNILQYIIRMGVFALISEIPYDLVFSGKILEFERQNVYFTLFFGLICLYILSSQMTIVVKACACVGIAFVADILHTDYGAFGITLILTFYYFRERKVLQLIGVGILNIFIKGKIQSYAILAMIPILLYNGKRGPNIKYVFYIFYPLHLTIIFLIKKELFL